jgi:hypothetical protein
MIFSELKALIRAELDEATASLYTDTNIANWITAAELDIAAKTGCLEQVSSLSTTIGSRFVAFTGNKVNCVEYLASGTSIVLVGAENQWVDTSDSAWHDTNLSSWYNEKHELVVSYPPYSNARITAHHLGHIATRQDITPQYWFQWGNYIVIEPLPTDVYNLNVYVSYSPTSAFTSATDDNTTPQIPDEFQDAIIPFAVCRGRLKARKYEDAAYKYAEYISLVQRLIDNYVRRSSARFTDIRLPDM